jgi:hypothetical protein
MRRDLDELALVQLRGGRDGQLHREDEVVLEIGGGAGIRPRACARARALADEKNHSHDDVNLGD